MWRVFNCNFRLKKVGNEDLNVYYVLTELFSPEICRNVIRARCAGRKEKHEREREREIKKTNPPNTEVREPYRS